MEPSNYRERVPPANVWALTPGQPIRNIDDASALAQAIVDTIRDPLLVLDQDLRVVTANRSFYQMFRMVVRTFTAARFTGWAMDSGIFPDFGSCWRTSRRNTP